MGQRNRPSPLRDELGQDATELGTSAGGDIGYGREVLGLGRQIFGLGGHEMLVGGIAPPRQPVGQIGR